MTWPPRGPLLIAGIATIATVVVCGLAVVIKYGSLDTADKAASVVGMLAAVASVALYLWHRQYAANSTEPAHPVPWFKQPPVWAALMAISSLLLFVILVVSNGGDNETSSAPPALPSTTPPPSPSPSPSLAPTQSPSPERCAPTGASGALPTTSPIPAVMPTSALVSDIRRAGTLTLPEGYYADLDSLCTDWDVTDAYSGAADLFNDGIGLARNMTDTQIAAVGKGEKDTYEMCASNTEYVATTIKYSELSAGSRYCVLTSDGRRSLVTATKVSRTQGRTSLRLSIRTWAPAQPKDESDPTPYIVAGILLLILLSGSGATATAASKNKKADNKREADNSA